MSLTPPPCLFISRDCQCWGVRPEGLLVTVSIEKVVVLTAEPVYCYVIY